MSDIKLKLCPYLPQKKEIKAIAIGTGDATITYFDTCLGEECAAYLNGRCMYGGANIEVVKTGGVDDARN